MFVGVVVGIAVVVVVVVVVFFIVVQTRNKQCLVTFEIVVVHVSQILSLGISPGVLKELPCAAAKFADETTKSHCDAVL